MEGGREREKRKGRKGKCGEGGKEQSQFHLCSHHLSRTPLARAVASVKEARGHQISAGGTTKWSAQGASVEAPQAPRGVGCEDGAVPQKIFYISMLKWRVLWVFWV